MSEFYIRPINKEELSKLIELYTHLHETGDAPLPPDDQLAQIHSLGEASVKCEGIGVEPGRTSGDHQRAGARVEFLLDRFDALVATQEGVGLACRRPTFGGDLFERLDVQRRTDVTALANPNGQLRVCFFHGLTPRNSGGLSGRCPWRPARTPPRTMK